ncbi:conserved hypothetical protein [Perkinsus marinus ATCC 50983]|uniref:C3H1-type domain-containing protein n=1 Tax=Perkinsus marinus (strain ATCC 50983 / TXsc) TaxID=423536 RepID=C5LUX4_PERM5|nr:conserved hypothetical protein [Perkinsus marinus ATCC 50983]EEQ99474.1 conserved hypothetical protein [Perkinsus marinus ATCC 50983]|eukprot:XP_002766757.1 conserved hypothetical protein [Perkinsus marinus ATCC 50983]
MFQPLLPPMSYTAGNAPSGGRRYTTSGASPAQYHSSRQLLPKSRVQRAVPGDGSEGLGSGIRQQLYKTKFCRHFIRGSCKYGEDCTYAHSIEELAARPNFYKTKICTRPNCNDPDCQYAHSIYELQDFYAKEADRICPSFLAGQCNDSSCPMSHNRTQASEMMLAQCFNLMKSNTDRTVAAPQHSSPSLQVVSSAESSSSHSDPRSAVNPLAQDTSLESLLSSFPSLSGYEYRSRYDV